MHAIVLYGFAGICAALGKLCRLLPEYWRPNPTLSQLQMLLNNAMAGSLCAQTFSMLLGLPAAAELSTGSVLELLMPAMVRASRVSSEAKKTVRFRDTCTRLTEALPAVVIVLRSLLALPAAQQLTADDMTALLQCSVSHGLLEVTKLLLELPMTPDTASSEPGPGLEAQDAGQPATEPDGGSPEESTQPSSSSSSSRWRRAGLPGNTPAR
jgi:hypothetical protein